MNDKKEIQKKEKAKKDERERERIEGEGEREKRSKERRENISIEAYFKFQINFFKREYKPEAENRFFYFLFLGI